jgi:hypothetical protein
MYLSGAASNHDQQHYLLNPDGPTRGAELFPHVLAPLRRFRGVINETPSPNLKHREVWS